MEKQFSKIDTSSLPEVKHPFADMTLKDAVTIANSHAILFRRDLPDTIEQARELVNEIDQGTPYNWLTGKAALDVFDAYLDDRVLAQSSRIAG